MPTKDPREALPDLIECGLPKALLHDNRWYEEQSSIALFRLVQTELQDLHLEASCIGDLGLALDELHDATDSVCDGIGILLKCYSAVAEVRYHVASDALAHLNLREHERLLCEREDGGASC